MAIVTHTRTEVTISKIVPRPTCPYCKERPIRKSIRAVTCGHPYCQYKNQIYRHRKKRKTNIIVLCKRVEL